MGARCEAAAITLVRRKVRVRDLPRIARAVLEHVGATLAGSNRRMVGAGAVIRDPEGRLLVVHTGYRPGWGLPGGRIGRGESLERGLAREVREETGYDVRVGPLLVVDASETGKVVFVFGAEIVGGRPDPAPLEIRALRWASADELAAVPEPDRTRLRVALAAAGDGRVEYVAEPTIGR